MTPSDPAVVWVPDVLDAHEQTTLDLPGVAPENGETTAPVATLVRRVLGSSPRPAVLYVHGWNDYFFQTHLSAAFDEAGYDFYALDLRRYGRSLREGQFGGYITDVAHYDVELDRAREVIAAAGHPSIVLHGHSTGGLITTLHASRRPGTYAALVLNAPWLDMANQPLIQALSRGIDAAAPLAPTAVMLGTGTEDAPGDYARTLHRDHDGEWDYDWNWKSNPAVFALRYGWMRAIIRGQRAVARGLSIDCPILVATSDSSTKPKAYDATDSAAVDLVLDVRSLARKAVNLGDHVTVVRIPAGIHDLALSRPGVRAHYLREVMAWLAAYGPSGSAVVG